MQDAQDNYSVAGQIALTKKQGVSGPVNFFLLLNGILNPIKRIKEVLFVCETFKCNGSIQIGDFVFEFHLRIVFVFRSCRDCLPVLCTLPISYFFFFIQRWDLLHFNVIIMFLRSWYSSLSSSYSWPTFQIAVHTPIFGRAR